MKDGIVLRKLLIKRIKLRHHLSINDQTQIVIRKVSEDDVQDKHKEFEVIYDKHDSSLVVHNIQESFIVEYSEFKKFEKALKDTRYTLGDNAPKTDMVNSPDHYKKRYIREVIQSIKGLCTPEEYRGYLKGSKIKYLARYQDKGGIEDLEKGQWYGDELIAFEKEQKNKTQEATQ